MKKQNNIFIIIGFIAMVGLWISTGLFFYVHYYSLKEELAINDDFIDNSISLDHLEDWTLDNVKVMAHIQIPTYNQAVAGYILGCEGVSLYMALRGLGYIKDYSIDRFMATMPQGKTPYEGYMGNSKIGHYGENTGKRTTIYPEALAKWASSFARAEDLTGASINKLKSELDKGHVILAFVTGGWQDPRWKHYSWSKQDKGEVENNHCLCVVGYNSNGDFLVNDCHDGRYDGRQGEYWVSAEKFMNIYNVRNYAVSVY